MINTEKLKVGSLIRITNNGPYSIEKFNHKYILVKEVVYDKYKLPGIYSNVYYYNPNEGVLKLHEGKDIFVDFLWVSNLNKIKYAAKIVDELTPDLIGTPQIPYKYD